MVLKIYRSVALRFRVFKDKHEMNEHVSAHIFAAGKKLHKNARAVLNMITQFSIKYNGVSWLSEETIATKLEVHVDTVKRALKRLVELHIGRFEVVGVSGLTLRYFVLNHFELADDLLLDECETTLDNSSVESIPNDTKHLEARESRDNNELSNNVQDELPSDYTPSHVPMPFKEVVSAHFNNAKTIYTLWQKSLIAYRQSLLNKPIESLLDTISVAFRDTVFALKNNRIKGSFDGFYFGVLRNVFAIERRREVNLIPSWLQS